MLPLSIFKSTPKSNIKVTIENKGNWQKKKGWKLTYDFELVTVK
jgi:hypothetical protein